MNFFKQWGRFMMAGAQAHARWEMAVSNTILNDRRRLLVLGLLTVPVLLGGVVFADEIAGALPGVLGGKKAYSPAFYSTGIFIVSILIGLGAGLITGAIGAGGGFIIAPALMSAGIKGILAVG
ncbi:MAG: sulfite exporter TauE/SafE family protein, partial [Desulfobacterales bacterium]|nr:sulfite exporter TauE/SafE family protein [Desulfobacterales bacterium]